VILHSLSTILLSIGNILHNKDASKSSFAGCDMLKEAAVHTLSACHIPGDGNSLSKTAPFVCFIQTGLRDTCAHDTRLQEGECLSKDKY